MCALLSHLVQAPPKLVPRKLEDTRIKDETLVQANDEEIALEEQQDEFAQHFAGARPPNVLLTTSRKPSKVHKRCCCSLRNCCCCCCC